MNPKVDLYLTDGCGRCNLFATPQCKVHRWNNVLITLRTIVQQCGLTEELKWGVPCYTYQNKNVLTVSALKSYCSISFFKGALLKDTYNVLTAPGKNSQAARQIRFASVSEVSEKEQIVKSYINEAVEIENNGLQIDFKAKNELEYPAELWQKMEEDLVFKSAFEALSPGRKRGYVMYFSAAKQPETRKRRIEKYEQQIFEGKGLQGK